MSECPSCHAAIDPGRAVCTRCWRPIPEPAKPLDLAPEPTSGRRDGPHDDGSFSTCPRCGAERPRTLSACPYCLPSASAAAVLNFAFGSWTIQIGEPLLVGRSADSPLASHVAANLSISRSHARFDFNGRSVHLTDLGSVNGTFLNGKQVEPGVPIEVQASDVIRLGRDSPIEAQLAGRPRPT